MDDDDETVFARTVDWAISQGIETATFHILTPYPNTALYQRMTAQGRMLHHHWDLYDTRHVVFRPAKMAAAALEAGYWQAYRDFYRWESIFKSGWTKPEWAERFRHLAYAGGWKKFEFLWDWVIRTKRAASALPVLEAVLAYFGRYLTSTAERLRLDGYELPRPTNNTVSSTNTTNMNVKVSHALNHFAELQEL